MFSEVPGVLFLFVIAIIVIFAWKTKRTVKKQDISDLSIAMSVLPQIEMKLTPSTIDDWQEKEQLNQTQSELERYGASHGGYYSFSRANATILVSIWSYREQAVAVIYETSSALDKDKVSFVIEVSSKLEDGSVCITTNQDAVLDSRPSKHRIVFNESSSIRDLFKATKAELKDDEKYIKITDPKEYLVDCHEAISEWGWRAEQLKNEKTQQALTFAGINMTEKFNTELINIGIDNTVYVGINHVRRKLSENPNMRVEEWEEVKDKLVYVNEFMQPYHLTEAVEDLVEKLTELQETTLDDFEDNTKELTDPIGSFQMLLRSLNLNTKRIARMDSPVKTEVYLLR